MAEGKSTDYSKIMIIPLTEGTGCDFCFARPPSEMVDPQALPCGHSRCTKCLEVNYQYKEIECKTCRWVLNKTTYWPYLVKKGHYIGLVAKLYLLATQLPKFACIVHTVIFFRSSYRDIDILSLPRTPQSYIDNAVETKPEGLPCDLCREDENDAVVCCTDCKKRLCHKHAQVNIDI